MKTLIKVFILSLLTSSVFAQTEFSKGDTLAASQTTRVRDGANAAGFRGSKGSTGNFRRYAFYDEVVAASAGGVQTVNSITPSGGNVNVTFSNLIGKPTTISGFGITDGVSTGGNYVNPTWLTSIPFTKLIALPTSLSGHGITDGVSTGSTYANPTWLTSLAFTKLTSLPTTLAGYGITDGATQSAVNQKADASAVVPFSSVSAYSNLSGVTSPASGFLKFVRVGTDERYTETNSLYIIDSAGKISKITTIKEN